MSRGGTGAQGFLGSAGKEGNLGQNEEAKESCMGILNSSSLQAKSEKRDFLRPKKEAIDNLLH